jgi:hypothetical protein
MQIVWLALGSLLMFLRPKKNDSDVVPQVE